MRFRSHEVVDYRPGGDCDLFSASLPVSFQRYKGHKLAVVYVKNEGYRTVRTADLSRRSAVAA